MKGENVTGHNGLRENDRTRERERERERERKREEVCNISEGHAIIKSRNVVYIKESRCYNPKI